MENSNNQIFLKDRFKISFKGCVKISFYTSRYELVSTRIFCTENKIPSDETLEFTRLSDSTFGGDLKRIEEKKISDVMVFFVSGVPYKSDKNYEDNMY